MRIDDDVPPIVRTLVQPDYGRPPTLRELWHWYWPDLFVFGALGALLGSVAGNCLLSP
jgi:hypothetical protein